MTDEAQRCLALAAFQDIILDVAESNKSESSGIIIPRGEMGTPLCGLYK